MATVRVCTCPRARSVVGSAEVQPRAEQPGPLQLRAAGAGPEGEAGAVSRHAVWSVSRRAALNRAATVVQRGLYFIVLV